MAHNATHDPFRDWCPISAASRGRSSPHRRVVVNKTAGTLPKFQTDYMFIRTVTESRTQPCITFVQTRSGVVISFMCAPKGAYEDLTKEILRHFEAYGFLIPIIIQCHKVMSIIDLCRKVARERNARTVIRFAPKTSHQSNGFVEAVHGHIQVLARGGGDVAAKTEMVICDPFHTDPAKTKVIGKVVRHTHFLKHLFQTC